MRILLSAALLWERGWGAVSHEQDTTDTTTVPERWRLNEVRPAASVRPHDDFNCIRARIETRHDGHPGTVTADNRNGRGDAPGFAGLDLPTWGRPPPQRSHLECRGGGRCLTCRLN